ncbi:ATP-binding protein [Spirillospora sp. CA-142024]|uniref:ATP-binding protein n=1 Tax=Spirillospora sp. CA-142024 TaxID=3240036 RepID=UPI003D8CBB0E
MRRPRWAAPGRWSLARQLLVLQAAIVGLLVAAGAVLAYADSGRAANDSATQTVTAVAASIADSPDVQAALTTSQPTRLLQPYAERIRHDTGVDFITIMNPAGIRYTHPNPSRIGGEFVGNTARALAGHTFTETYTGTLGSSVRAVAPVFGPGHRVVAMVAVGITVKVISAELRQRLLSLAVVAMIVLAVGMTGSYLVSERLRRQTRGVAPRELREMFEYYQAILHSVREGLLILDRTGRVVLCNDAAHDLLDLNTPKPPPRAPAPPHPPADVVTPDLPADVVTCDPSVDAVARDLPAEAVAPAPPADAVIPGPSADAVARDLPAGAVTRDLPAEAVTCDPSADAVAVGLAAGAVARDLPADAVPPGPSADAVAAGPSAEAGARDLPADLRGRAAGELGLPRELVAALVSAEPRSDEIHVGDTRVLVVNTSPVRSRGRVLGNVVTLRDHTELQGLTGELDTVRGFAESLRSQAHEAANRLHTVVSLVELGRSDQAVEFATAELESAQRLTDRVVGSVNEPVLAALLLGKSAEAGERGVELVISDDTAIEGVIEPRDLVTILGNLIDNAVDAAIEGSGARPPRVVVSARQDDGALVLEVSDSGPGVDPSAVPDMFRRGWTTKTSGGPVGHGLGLALVGQAVRRNGGDVQVGTADPVTHTGAVFTVHLPAGGPGEGEPGGEGLRGGITES